MCVEIPGFLPRPRACNLPTSPMIPRLITLLLALTLAAHALTPSGEIAAQASEQPARLPTVDEEIHRAIAATPQAMQFRGTTADELRDWQKRFSAKLNELIGPHAPPKTWKARLLSRREFPDFTREELLMEAEGTPSLPLYVLRPAGPANARFPIVLCLHGHGDFGHDAVAGVDDRPEIAEAIRQSNYDYGRQLARRGFLTIAPCFTPFGRRLDPKQRGAGKMDPCAVEFIRLLVLGKTLIGENLRDAQWALDYAVTRPDVRADRIGCVGLSYGGRMTMLTTALDSRIRVAVAAGAMNLFQERIEALGYACGSQVIPHLLEYGDTPEIFSLIAPRPLVCEVGSHDSLHPAQWLPVAQERIARAYQASGQPANFTLHRFDGGHVWNGEAALPLLEKVLKAGRD